MQDEQPKNNETPKIVALLVLVVLVLGVGIFNFMKLSGGGGNHPVQNNMANGSGGTAVTPVSSTASVAGPGEVREHNPLDEESPSPIPTRNLAVAFNPPPKPIPPTDIQVIPPGPGQRPIRPIDGGVQPGGSPPIKPVPQLPPTHADTIKVEGVVTGPDGFAMISMGNQTVFKHVGDTLDTNYRVTRLSENGVVVRHRSEEIQGSKTVWVSNPEIWPIGEPVNLMAPGAGQGGASVPGVQNAPAPMPSSLPPMESNPQMERGNGQMNRRLPRGVRSYLEPGGTDHFMPTIQH